VRTPSKEGCVRELSGVLLPATDVTPSDRGTYLRTFSAFPDGWPGGGLLLQRAAVGLPLIYWGIADLAAGRLSAVPDLAAAAAGLLLVCGLFTRVAGAAITAAQVWIFFSPEASKPGEPWIVLVLGALSLGVAMLGPGAWSVDAYRFGRKVFEIRENRRPGQ